MKKILIFSMLLLFLTGCDMGKTPFLSACRKKAGDVITENGAIPSFKESKKLGYTYIIDGYQYSDRLITGEEEGAFDFLKLISLLGIESSTEGSKINLSYMGMKISLEEAASGSYSIYIEEKEADFGIKPYSKNGRIYVKEDEVMGISDSKKLPLDVEIDEEAKTVRLTNSLFSGESTEIIKYFDVTEYKGEKTTLICDGEVMKIKVGDTEYEKNLEGEYIDGKIVVSTDNKSDVTVYLWDGSKIKTIPLKLN